MFHLTTCPTCQTRFTIPEAQVGRRQICPHCQSPFVAGKSVAVADVPMKPETAEAPYNKTMLAETTPPIRFNCPRCKKSLEVPAIEAGAKKPCPHCGQRLQVPAAPAPAKPAGLDKTMLASNEVGASSPAPDPALNKTMLVSNNEPPIRFDCPRCKKNVEVPASEAGSKRPCPSCGQRLQVPMASTNQPNLNKTMMVSDGASTVVPQQQPQSPSMPHTPGVAAQTPSQQQSTPAPAFPLNLSPRVYTIAGVVGGIFLLLFILMVFAPSHDQRAYLAAQKEVEELEKKIETIKQEQAQIKEKELWEKRFIEQIDERKRENAAFAQKIAQLSESLRRQKLDLDQNYDDLTNILDEDLRRQRKAKLDQQKAQMRREESEIKASQDEIQAKIAAAKAEEQRLERERRDREERQMMLQMQMQQNSAALSAAAISASRPAYYPWHPSRYWPW